jgi:lipoprotein-releasing system permease protein
MFFIAYRQMTARKLQTFLTLLGIVFGTIGYIVISGVMLGFRVYLLEQLVNSDAHIKISPKVEIITLEKVEPLLFPETKNVSWFIPTSGKKDTSELRNAAFWFTLLSEDNEIEAFSRQFSIKVILNKGNQSDAARLVGVEPYKHSKVTNISENMVTGKYSDLGETGNKIIIGEGLGENLGIRINDTIYLSSGMGKTLPFKVVGSFRTGNKSVDDTVCYASLNDVQLLNRTPGKISSISIRLKDVNQVKLKTKEWLDYNLETVESWEDASASFLTIFKIQDTIRYSVTIAILVVSGFGIYNILNVLINQKKREIAILRSIGYESTDIIIIFLIQGVILGIVGSILGMIVGYLICLKLSTLSFSSPYLSTKTGKMLISYDLKIYVQAFFLALFSTLLASILPARSAGKLQPIEIIRGEL